LISRAIASLRDRVFLVSKVEADEVSGDSMARACAASLRRLEQIPVNFTHSQRA
jgi:diketogulonate reductase-like aldo/keto reductase